MHNYTVNDFICRVSVPKAQIKFTFGTFICQSFHQKTPLAFLCYVCFHQQLPPDF